MNTRSAGELNAREPKQPELSSSAAHSKSSLSKQALHIRPRRAVAELAPIVKWRPRTSATDSDNTSSNNNDKSSIK